MFATPLPILLSSFAPPKIEDKNPIFMKSFVCSSDRFFCFNVVIDFFNHFILVIEFVEIPFEFMVTHNYTFGMPYYFNIAKALNNVEICTYTR